uniref:Uncharacterized protein TCIL3000_5_3390 n=1 Tax=Trypanosoma congolense (strain IL3000) TaxID=1068625 RepID=G0ULU9_TRYCI|nr:unnamed protein product [Trypanosoma congolense IL3000]
MDLCSNNFVLLLIASISQRGVPVVVVMTSIASPLKGTSVDLPWKLLVAAAQPYQTLSGPALSINFLRQPALMPFQHLPFNRTGVPGLYFHSLLHSLAEFSTTPRPVRDSHVKMLHAPMEDFWNSLGLLNSVYYTLYTPFSAEHPEIGAVELASPSHRNQKDIRMSLYNGTYQPVATMIATGATSGAELDPSSQCGTSAAPLAYRAVGAVMSASPLVGDLTELPDGSFRHEAVFTKSNHSEEGDVVPPWRLDECVVDFCRSLAVGGLLAPKIPSDRECNFVVAAQQVLAYDDVMEDVPVDIVSASPRVFARYRMPPWRHRIGLPLFGTGIYPPCVALCVEMRQEGLKKVAGTYFLTDTTSTL